MIAAAGLRGGGELLAVAGASPASTWSRSHASWWRPGGGRTEVDQRGEDLELSDPRRL